MTQKHTNSSQTSTTPESEKKTSDRSFRLQHIFDDVIYPQLSLRVCLSGPPEDRWGYTKWLGRAGCRFVTDPKDADFVIFTGGADVNPTMYGESALDKTWFDNDRDAEDNALYDLCVANRIPMVGICRGSQFLWVKQGGKLYQHVDKHNSGEHEIMCFLDQKKYRASSVHHQMARPESLKGMKLIANAAESTSRESNLWKHTGPSSDFEIWAFPEKGIIGIQGHPEYPGYPEYSALCARIIDKYIYDGPATIYKDGRLRVKEASNG